MSDIYCRDCGTLIVIRMDYGTAYNWRARCPQCDTYIEMSGRWSKGKFMALVQDVMGQPQPQDEVAA